MQYSNDEEMPDFSGFDGLLSSMGFSVEKSTEEKCFAEFLEIMKENIPEVQFKVTENCFLHGEKEELGDFSGNCFLNDYHIMCFQVYAGKDEDQKDVKYVMLMPISEDVFEENCGEALQDDALGEAPFDKRKKEMYQQIHRLVENYQTLFLSSIEKFDTPYETQPSWEVSNFEEYAEEGVKYLDEEPYPHMYMLSYDFNEGLRERLLFLASLKDFVEQAPVIEGVYKEVIGKHGAKNIFTA